MKLLWLCNSAPGVVRSHISGKPASGVNWVDHVLSGLRGRGFTVRVLYRGTGAPGVIDETCSYAAISETPSHIYDVQQEKRFREEIRSFQPDVIHTWGVEYHHSLAMVKAAEAEGKLPNMVASIQGLCRFLADHYTDGVPDKVCRKSTFRDRVRRDNLLQQQEKFVLRGKMETTSIEKLHHVIGRTTWDYDCAQQIHPGIHYHFCNETLREPFYEGGWRYEACKKHRIFASSCAYPVKGFHYLLEAFAQVVKIYPDATLAVTGGSFLSKSWKDALRQGSYEKYMASLVKKNHLEDKLVFLGNLSADEMKQAFLDANVFALPSTLENSPNSLGEAMLLGVPCVAADVGGVRNLMNQGSEGILYEPGNVQALTEGILQLFALEDRAASLGEAAANHARQTHDPEKNLQDLICIYENVCERNHDHDPGTSA